MALIEMVESEPGPSCGYDCNCCGFDDGTTPEEHARDCRIFVIDREGVGHDCTCGRSDEMYEATGVGLLLVALLGIRFSPDEVWNARARGSS